MTLLTTARAKLRRFSQSDLSPLTEMMTNPKVMQYTGFKTPQTDEKIQESLSKWMNPIDQNLGVWAAEFIDTSDLFGWFMLTPTLDERTPELGFMLKQDFWNMGLTTEVARALLSHGHHQLQYRRIIARTNPENKPSIHILKKLGMTSFKNQRESSDIIFFESLKD